MKVKRLRYNRRKVFLGLFLFLCLIGVTLGYAFVTTKLEIEGIATVKDAKWDVHFTNFQTMQGSVEPVSDPTVTNTNVTFSAKLDEPGDFYGFTIDVTNQGTINADISNISLTPDFSTIDYIDATVTYNNDNPIQIGDILAAGKTKTIKVLLKYKDGLADNLYPTQNQIHNVTLTLDYEQYVGEIQSWVLPQGKTKDTLTVGDEICAGDQCFNFIKYDGNDVVMLAKYNLNVGNNIQPGAQGVQNPLSIGYNNDHSTNVDNYWPSTIAFSETNYWYDSDRYQIKPEYGSDVPVDIYDDINYAGVPGSNTFSIAYYVKTYKNILESKGVSVKTARLLLLSEAIDSSIGCSVDQEYDGECPTTGSSAFITNTSFWLGSTGIGGTADVAYILGSYNQELFSDDYQLDSDFGVRPVIVVEKSEL